MSKPNITDFLDSITEDTNDSEITVVPLMCGTGKSSYISRKMKEVIQSNGNAGLLIVTDSVDRMQGYNNPYDNDLRQFIAENSNQIVTMTASNVSDAMRLQRKKPILIISTQRYFRLTRLEIIDLLTWRNGKRCLVLFDEKPYLSEQIKITIKTFTDIDAALQMAIDDTADQTEKSWAINQWQILERRMQSVMDGYEGLRDGQFYVYHKDVGCMTTDDERFMRIIESNRTSLNGKDIDAYTNICAIRQLVRNGAIFTCRKRKTTGDYEKCFTVLIDHRDKLIGLGAKVVILDATGDLTPEYDSEYIRVLPCTQFKRNLPNLTINIINIPTSKRNFSTKKYVHSVADWLCAEYAKMESCAVFTYKESESIFAQKGIRTAHFGNIKGRNDFRSLHSLIQIGLNRYPPIYYYLLNLSRNKEEVELLNKLSKQETLNYLTSILEDSKSNGDIMNRCLLADIEQNLFRCAIRNPEYHNPVTYTILLNTTEYAELVGMIKDRYGKLGATVNLLSTPNTLLLEKTRNRNTDKPTHRQAILNWLTTLPIGTEFKSGDMFAAVGITDKQFSKIKSQNEPIRKLFQNMATSRHGYYRVQ